MPTENRYLKAFQEQANIVGLTTAVALSAATLNPLPLLLGLVAEAAYLLFVPDSHWYEARLSQQYDGEVEKRRQELKDRVVPTLRPEMQTRFTRLEEMRARISAQPLEGQTWFREVIRKLDYLLEKFLQFAAKEEQFRTYLASLMEEARGATEGHSGRKGSRSQTAEDVLRDIWVLDDARAPRPRERGQRDARNRPPKDEPAPPAEDGPFLDPDERRVQEVIHQIQAFYDREMDSLRKLVEQEQDFNTRAVLEKRLDVLWRRHEFVEKTGKIVTNLNHQLHLLEDTFGLINDELQARSPDQVLADIEDVVSRTDTMTEVLEEMAPYEQLVARLSG
jgi:hypothetical protein